MFIVKKPEFLLITLHIQKKVTLSLKGVYQIFWTLRL